MRRWRIVLVALVLAATGARAASTFSPDATDLWWNPDESGWGVNMIQQSDTVFATLVIYGSDGRSRWYVASSVSRIDTNVRGCNMHGNFGGARATVEEDPS